jgi:hydrogenase large subunit
LALLDYVDGDRVLGPSPSSPRQSAPDLITGSEASALLVHYGEAMNVRRKIGQLGAIFGGRMPCSPVIVPGGCTPTLSDAVEMATAGEPKASERIRQFRSLLDEIRSFVTAAYLPDVQLLAKKFPQYGKIGRGAGNFLAYGGFNLDASGSKKLFQRGVYAGDSFTSLDPNHITESVKYSCYETSSGTINPSRGITLPNINKPDAYSWIKSPRYMNEAYEVGPLARMWISGFYRQGVSVMDRLLARAYETQKIADAMAGWVQELTIGEPTRAKVEYANSGIGVGLTEAPRGALGHWLEFREDAIRHYQILAPTGWNASPMDESGKKGPIEQALIGTSVRDRDQPIELLRVVHSFDPCLACSIH